MDQFGIGAAQRAVLSLFHPKLMGKAAYPSTSEHMHCETSYPYLAGENEDGREYSPECQEGNRCFTLLIIVKLCNHRNVLPIGRFSERAPNLTSNYRTLQATSTFVPATAV